MGEWRNVIYDGSLFVIKSVATNSYSIRAVFFFDRLGIGDQQNVIYDGTVIVQNVGQKLVFLFSVFWILRQMIMDQWCYGLEHFDSTPCVMKLCVHSQILMIIWKDLCSTMCKFKFSWPATIHLLAILCDEKILLCASLYLKYSNVGWVTVCWLEPEDGRLSSRHGWSVLLEINLGGREHKRFPKLSFL